MGIYDGGVGQGGVALVEAVNTELLVRLLTRHQEELFRYIFSLLPHEEDAKDVLQETSVALYRKFADYDPERPFLAWAYSFAHLEVLKQRERNSRGTRLWSQELVERSGASVPSTTTCCRPACRPWSIACCSFPRPIKR